MAQEQIVNSIDTMQLYIETVLDKSEDPQADELEIIAWVTKSLLSVPERYKSKVEPTINKIHDVIYHEHFSTL